MSGPKYYPFIYVHPELDKPWRHTSHTQEDAAKAFEDIWAMRVHEGLLEHVDGSFFDGEVRVGEVGQEDNLCPCDLSGHMWVDDTRTERREFVSRPDHKPTVCVLCKTVGWSEL